MFFEPTTFESPARLLPDGGSDIPEIVTLDEMPSAAETPGVDRRLAFETENNVMVRSCVEGDSATGWHHHGDRHVYVYLVEGDVALEFGPDGRHRIEGSAPMFAHIPPKVIHRDINPTDTEQISVINFVGTGPMVVNVDEPETAD